MRKLLMNHRGMSAGLRERGRVLRTALAAYLAAAVLMGMVPFGTSAVTVYAAEETEEDESENTAENTAAENKPEKEDHSDEIINDHDRGGADDDIYHYMVSLERRYNLDKKVMDNLYKVFDAATYYIANTDMTKAELAAYVSQTKGVLESTATSDVTQSTSEFIQVANNWKTPTVSYGQQVAIVLPIMNFGTEELRDLIVEPVTSSVVSEWPFKPDQTGYLQTEPFIPGNKNEDAAFANRREFTYYFTAREDVMTGYYPLKFQISYTKGGVRCDKPAELTIFVKTVGKPGSGYIGGTGEEQSMAKPRIIVTGFETEPADVYAGDIFTLRIHVKNTSSEQAVTNVLFDLQAAMEGDDKTNTYSAFLPTSGSSSVYMDSIGADASADIVIEMAAKAGLAQKPYVLDVNMKYDAGASFDLSDKASVSIPILQESRLDTSTPEISPADLTVGGQSNVMFDIYNTGKTTLYNLQVKFQADSIDEATSFVGNLTSGNTGNVDVMLTAIAPTMDDGTVNMIISYEDEAGNVSTVEKQITLFVSEMYFDEPMMGDDFMMEDGAEGEGRKSGKGWIIGGILGVAAVAGAAGAVFYVKRKKKKTEASLMDDLLDDINKE